MPLSNFGTCRICISGKNTRLRMKKLSSCFRGNVFVSQITCSAATRFRAKMFYRCICDLWYEDAKWYYVQLLRLIEVFLSVRKLCRVVKDFFFVGEEVSNDEELVVNLYQGVAR